MTAYQDILTEIMQEADRIRRIPLPELPARSGSMAVPEQVPYYRLMSYQGGAFIDNLYARLLGRMAEDEEYGHYLEALESGRMDREAIFCEVALSPEAVAKNVRITGIAVKEIRGSLLTALSDENFTKKIYPWLFDRDMDPAGEAYYRELFAKGAGRKAVLHVIAASEEVLGKGIRIMEDSGEELVDYETLMSPEGGAFFEGLYARLLGRLPDAETTAAHAAMLADGRLTKEALLMSVAMSGEAVSGPVRIVHISMPALDLGWFIPFEGRQFLKLFADWYLGGCLPEDQALYWQRMLALGAPRRLAAEQLILAAGEDRMGPRVTGPELEDRVDYADLMAAPEADFTDMLYARLLWRLPDAEGKASWEAALTEGRMDRGQIIKAIALSDEAVSKPIALIGIPPMTLEEEALTRLEGETFMREAFLWIMGREPDPAGLDYFGSLLAAGASKSLILHAMLATEEGSHREMCLVGGRYDGMTAGGPVALETLMSLPDGDFTEMSYLRLLGRYADREAYLGWRQQLAAGASRLDLLKGLLESPEGKARQAEITGFKGAYMKHQISRRLFRR